MEVHLIDGTYELFRHYFAVPKRQGPSGREVAAVGGVLDSMLGLLEGGATHVGIATDREVRSFRNALYDGYKAGENIEPELLTQFPILETVLAAAGFRVFAMIEHEADDAMATASAIAERDKRVSKVWICTPDKDLAQCVVDSRVVQFDRRQELEYDAAGVMEKFGVRPESIPDYLGLMGDSADGFPGLPAWGAKSASVVLAHYGHLEAIPDDVAEWEVKVRGAARLAETLASERERAQCCFVGSRRWYGMCRGSTGWTIGNGGGRRRRSRKCVSPSDGHRWRSGCGASRSSERGRWTCEGGGTG
jgi:5'-3' exonuclease